MQTFGIPEGFESSEFHPLESGTCRNISRILRGAFGELYVAP